MKRENEMKIEEIYEYMEKIGCLTFSTLHDGAVHSRIVHPYGHDEEGIYFMSMDIKPFARQLKKTGQVSVCGMWPTSRITGVDENGVPEFPPGFTLRIMGWVKEIFKDQVEIKAKQNPQFKKALFDMEKYPATCNFQIYKGKGEIFDYDFEMQNRDYKLHRTRFAFGGETFNPAGPIITEECTECGACFDVCTFKAIREGSPYEVISERCDECGSCVQVCPADAIKEPLTI
jgi:ferredoxin